MAWVIGFVANCDVVRPPGTPARFPACSPPRNDLRQDDNANAGRQHITATTSQRGDSTLRHPSVERHSGRLIPPTFVDSTHCAVDERGKCPSRQNGRQGRNPAPLSDGVVDMTPPEPTGPASWHSIRDRYNTATWHSPHSVPQPGQDAYYANWAMPPAPSFRPGCPAPLALARLAFAPVVLALFPAVRNARIVLLLWSLCGATAAPLQLQLQQTLPHQEGVARGANSGAELTQPPPSPRKGWRRGAPSGPELFDPSTGNPGRVTILARIAHRQTGWEGEKQWTNGNSVCACHAESPFLLLAILCCLCLTVLLIGIAAEHYLRWCRYPYVVSSGPQRSRAQRNPGKKPDILPPSPPCSPPESPDINIWLAAVADMKWVEVLPPPINDASGDGLPEATATAGDKVIGVYVGQNTSSSRAEQPPPQAMP